MMNDKSNLQFIPESGLVTVISFFSFYISGSQGKGPSVQLISPITMKHVKVAEN